MARRLISGEIADGDSVRFDRILDGLLLPSATPVLHLFDAWWWRNHQDWFIDPGLDAHKGLPP